MKSKKLGFLFLLLCAQFISSLAFDPQEAKVLVYMNGNSYIGKDGVKHNDLVWSKASSGKGAYGGQNNRPPNTKKSKAVSMFLKHGYMSNVAIGVIITNIILVLHF